MKKVLILAYDFPPYVSVGALRPYAWFKHLKEYDIEPIVVTRQWQNKYGNNLDYISASINKTIDFENTEYGQIVRAPYFPTVSNKLLLKFGVEKFRLLRKLLTAWHELTQFYWISGPKKHLFFAAQHVLKNEKVDAIIATGEPFVLFYFAEKLSKEFDIPWIADYRDPWTTRKNRTSVALLNYLFNKIERSTTKTAVAQIVPSHFIQHLNLQLFPNATIHVLPNGYDNDVINKVKECHQESELLSISFAGTIYDWHPWKEVLEVFSHVCNTAEQPMKLNFIGTNRTKEISNFICKFSSKVRNSIFVFDKLPNEILVQKLASSNVMLLFNDYSVLGTKIFDYLGVRRKILLCFGADKNAIKLKNKYFHLLEYENSNTSLQSDLILKTQSGFTIDDSDHLHSVLWDLLDEFTLNKKINCESQGIEEYSRNVQVEKLAQILKSGF